MTNEDKFKALCNILRNSFLNGNKFIAEKQWSNYLWVGTSDSEIGFILCHYEVLLRNNDSEDEFVEEQPYITASVNIESCKSELREPLVKVCKKEGLKILPSRNKNYEWFDNGKRFPLDEALAKPEKIIKELSDL